jgi:hypothetical protein
MEAQSLLKDQTTLNYQLIVKNVLRHFSSECIIEIGDSNKKIKLKMFFGYQLKCYGELIERQYFA